MAGLGRKSPMIGIGYPLTSLSGERPDKGSFRGLLDALKVTTKDDFEGSCQGGGIADSRGDLSTTSLMFHESTREEVMVMAEGESLMLVLPRTLCGLLRFPISLSL